MIDTIERRRSPRIAEILAEHDRAKIFNWEVRRSGAFQTITGVDIEGKAVRVAKVTSIFADPAGEVKSCVYATVDHGPGVYCLMLERKPV